MRLNYEVLAEKGDIALVRRGKTNSEYAVVRGLVSRQERTYNGTDWDATIDYWSCNIDGLQCAIECFRNRTENDYIRRWRLEELATLFKDGLIEDDRESAMKYFEDVCEMDENEKEFFGLDEIEEDN